MGISVTFQARVIYTKVRRAYKMLADPEAFEEELQNQPVCSIARESPCLIWAPYVIWVDPCEEYKRIFSVTMFQGTSTGIQPGHGLVAEITYIGEGGVREWVGGLVRPSANFGQNPPPPPPPLGGVMELLGCGSGFGSGLGLLWVETV